MGLIGTKHAFMLVLRRLEDLIFTVIGGLAVLLFAPIAIFVDTVWDAFVLIIKILGFPYDLCYSLYFDLTGRTKELCEKNPRFKAGLTGKRHKYVY